MGGGAWWAAVPGVAKSRTRLSDFPFTFYFHALEKEMATHSSVLACRIPGTGEPGGPPSMGSHRVGHDWSDLAAAAAYSNVKEKGKKETSRNQICWKEVCIYTGKLFCKVARITYIYKQDCEIHISMKHTVSRMKIKLLPKEMLGNTQEACPQIASVIISDIGTVLKCYF